MRARIVIALCLITMISGKAQDLGHVDKKCSVGVSAGEFGYDTGVGIEFGTPAFFNRLHVRIKANKTWLESYEAAYDHWSTYNLMGASIVYRVATVERSIVYTEVGGHVVFPSVQFSDISHIQGINGVFGVDLFMKHTSDFALSYFICGGWVYTEAYAEKLERYPRYANGFLFSNGLRFYF